MVGTFSRRSVGGKPQLGVEMISLKTLGLMALLLGVSWAYQVKPRNYHKLVEQQKKFNGSIC